MPLLLYIIIELSNKKKTNTNLTSRNEDIFYLLLPAYRMDSYNRVSASTIRKTLKQKT